MIVERVIGGAGTGKTTDLLRMIDNYRDNPLSVGFISFTKAARAEAVDRANKAWGLDDDDDLLETAGWFKTIHALAYRQLEVKGNQLLSGSKKDCEWLTESLDEVVQLTTGMSNQFAGSTAATALNLWKLCRTRLMTLRNLIAEVARYDPTVPTYDSIADTIELYESAKRLDGRVDFEDLLLEFSGFSYRDGRPLTVEPSCPTPEGVSTWIVDEAQDNSPLLDACCRRLAEAEDTKHMVLAGDPFQSINSFNGADFRMMMNWKVDKDRVLKTSWRCPNQMIRLGEACLRTTDGYFDREIVGTGDDGMIRKQEIVQRIDPRIETMVLARTNFRANEIRKELESMGIVTRGLQSAGKTNKARALAALYAYENDEPVEYSDLREAIAHLPQTFQGQKLMKRGLKTQTKKSENAEQFDVSFTADLEAIGFEEPLRNMIEAGCWCNLIDGGTGFRKSCQQFGLDVTLHPKIKVGTVHASKGLESDSVYVYMPTSNTIRDCSVKDRKQLDEEKRIAYVAVTRAKKNLTLVGGGRNKMEIPV